MPSADKPDGRKDSIETERFDYFEFSVFYSSIINKVDIETYRNYCLEKKGVTEELPFDENTLVFKVMSKMFAITDIDAFTSINLKCDPELAVELRDRYPSVLPGYHMSKKHWNTVVIDGLVADKQILEWIDRSYDLVVEGLTNKLKDELKAFDS